MTSPQVDVSQTYDPYQLIQEVVALLHERGLDPVTYPGHLAPALAGAGALLRAVGITPAIDHAASLGRSVSLVWGESQDE